MSFNKIILSGNVCQDPEIKTFGNGGKIARVSMATNERGYKTKEGKEIPDRTDFHALNVHNPGLVALFEKYVHKGDKITVSGPLHYREYTDKDNVNRRVAEITVTDFDFCGGAKKNDAPAAQATPANNSNAGADDLPFY